MKSMGLIQNTQDEAPSCFLEEHPNHKVAAPEVCFPGPAFDSVLFVSGMCSAIPARLEPSRD